MISFRKRLLVLAVAIGAPAVANAQSRNGFAIDRFEPAERGSSWFVVDPLDIRGGARSFGATLDYAYKPLVLYDPSGDEHSALVRHQTFVHLGGSFVLLERLRLAVNLPLAVYQDGEATIVSGQTHGAATEPAFGDVRMAADVRFFGEPAGSITLAAGLRVWLPTGSPAQFTSDGATRLAPQVLASGRLGWFAWATRIAIVYRSHEDEYVGRALGSEIFAAGGGGVRARDGRLFIGPELYAASAFTGGATFLGKRETPVDWAFGAHYDVLPSLRIGAGIGGGFGRGYGSPLVRALASIEYVTPPEPARRDDGAAKEEPRTPWEGGEGEGGRAPPLATVTESEIRIEEQLRFATDSAELIGESDAVLAAVKRLLDEHPEIGRVRIEGHTDSVGDPAYNDDLSARRAGAVKAWLVQKGIVADRLESAGVGSREPIAPNDTEEGRAKNRRVVFKILERR